MLQLGLIRHASVGLPVLIFQLFRGVLCALYSSGFPSRCGAAIGIRVAFMPLLQQSRIGEHRRGHDDESRHECDRKPRAFHGFPPYLIEMDKTVSSKRTSYKG